MNDEVILIDDFLSTEQSEEVERKLSKFDFPWWFIKTSTYQDGPNLSLLDKNIYATTPVFRHCFLDIVKKHNLNMDYFDIVSPFFVKIQHHMNFKVEFTRIMANLLIGNDKNIGKIDVPHIDMDPKEGVEGYTAIYYVNESDGQTILFDEKWDINYPKPKNGIVSEDYVRMFNSIKIHSKIEPKKNRFVVWKSDRLHAAPCYCSSPRFVINFNFNKKMI